MKPTYQKKSFGARKGTYKGSSKGGGDYSGSTWKREGAHSHDRADRPTLHSATCSHCGAACEVPFKPNGKKPVSCRDCYKKEAGATSTGRGEGRGFGRTKSYEKPSYTSGVSNSDVVDQLKTLNMKMDLVLRALAEMGKKE